MAWGDKPFGLHQIKLVNFATVPVVVTLPNAITMSFKERVKSGELSGDDKTVAVVAYSDALEWSIEAGGINLEAWALMTGRTATTASTTPTRTTTVNADAGTAFPYFKIYGKSLGDGIDDVHVKIYKAKLTKPLEGEFTDGKFFITSCSGIAVDDGTNGIYDVVQNETAAALPSA